jgi:hypothetical protein
MNHFWTWTRNGTPVVTTPDAVDIANEGMLRRKLLAAGAWNPVVVVDTSMCMTFFSVSAMRVLDEAGRRMADAGGELRVVIAKPKRRYHLEVARCDRHLRIFESLTEALDAPEQDRKPRPQAA